MNIKDYLTLYISQPKRILYNKGVRVMVFNATFNNISVISWRSVLLVEGTGKNHRPTEVTDKLYYMMLYGIHIAWAGFEITTLVGIGTDCIGSYKSNYHSITTTTPYQQRIQLISYECEMTLSLHLTNSSVPLKDGLLLYSAYE